MRSPDGQKIVKSPLSRPLRARSEPGNIGGRFVAHGVAPASFMPMPKPRRMSQPEAEPAPKGRGVAVRASTKKPKKVNENNERQARERPTGFVPGKQCSWCAELFSEQALYSYHRAVCVNRPGGPLPTGPFSAASANGILRLPSKLNGKKMLTILAEREYAENGFPLHILAKMEAEGRA